MNDKLKKTTIEHGFINIPTDKFICSKGNIVLIHKLTRSLRTFIRLDDTIWMAIEYSSAKDICFDNNNPPIIVTFLNVSNEHLKDYIQKYYYDDFIVKESCINIELNSDGTIAYASEENFNWQASI